jgi:hypothetical protein
MKAASALVPCLAAILLAPTLSAQAPKPIIENDRVIVWDLKPGDVVPDNVARQYDCVRVTYARNAGTAVFEPKNGAHAGKAAGDKRTLLIGLNDHTVAALPNNTKYPNAFPRPHVKKLIENDRIITWEYSWTPNEPTPMHFHDKDVVVLYLDDGSLKSTTPDGESVMNDYTYGLAKFNARDRTHTELLVKGQQHAIMTELK